MLSPCVHAAPQCTFVVQAHVEWEAGEPAVCKYWMRRPAAARSTTALKAEEGVSQVSILSDDALSCVFNAQARRPSMFGTYLLPG